MEIIKRGNLYELRTFECGVCGCQFRCDPRDYIGEGEEIIRESYDEYRKIVTYAPYTMAKCPCCNRVAREISNMEDI